MRLNAKQIAAYTGGQFLVDPIDASALMTGITWDSREVRPGWLYVALPGERVDGALKIVGLLPLMEPTDARAVATTCAIAVDKAVLIERYLAKAL